jgi:type IV pilus assembly protein PilP
MPKLVAPAAAALGVALAFGLASGCEPDYQAGPPAPQAPPTDGTPQITAPPDADAGVDGSVAALHYRDEDFVEANVNRDPFRSFAKMFRVRPPDAPQRTVVMATVGVDEMKLIAIVSGVANPRAMFNDRVGVGYVVERGDYVGRGETVQTGGEGGMSVLLNWRVDRIREGEVVLTREDPTAPNRPPLTRVIALHDENETPTP